MKHPHCIHGAYIATVLTVSCGAATAATAALPAPLRDDKAVAVAIDDASHRFAVPPDWIRAVIAVESAGHPGALSPKGAMGLMQIMPATWKVLRARYNLGPDAYDIHDNILAGTALLRELYDRFGGQGFLAAYNAGPSRYLSFLATGQPLRVETVLYLSELGGLLHGELGNAAFSTTPLQNWRNASLYAAAWQASGATAQANASPGNRAAPTGPQAAAPDRASPAPLSGLTPGDGGLFALRTPEASP